MFTLFTLESVRSGVAFTTGVTEVQWLVYVALLINISIPGEWLDAVIAIDIFMLFGGCCLLSLLSSSWRLTIPLVVHVSSVIAAVCLSSNDTLAAKILLAVQFALLNAAYCFRLNVGKVLKQPMQLRCVRELVLAPIVALAAIMGLQWLSLVVVTVYYVTLLTQGLTSLCSLQGCGFLEVKPS
eukprot:TRINITY_DN22685_c0_g1_i3.p1 TRINITY_DN22685_c0_g1~~TRINITY_DN22685_c0_g1_i3.p1  ORF type:complete len:183 (+),score=23.45 TRINITY_DN22685_c0_g1_i3:513-1061(+)